LCPDVGTRWTALRAETKKKKYKLIHSWKGVERERTITWMERGDF